MGDLSTLSIRLGLDAKAFTAGLGKVRDQLHGFKNSAAGKWLFGGGALGKAVGGAVSGLPGKIFGGLGASGSAFLGASMAGSPIGIATGLVVETGRKLKEAMDWAESIGQQHVQRSMRNRRLGIGDLAGTAIERLGGGNADRVFEVMPKLQKVIGAAGEGSDEARRKLQGLGLSFQDLRRLSPDDALITVSKRISALGSDAERTRAAFNLFEEAGPTLVPTLHRIASGFEEAKTKAAELGAAPSQAMVDATRTLERSKKDRDKSWESSPLSLALVDYSAEFNRNTSKQLNWFTRWLGVGNDPQVDLRVEALQKRLRQQEAEAKAGVTARNNLEGDLRVAIDQVDTDRRALGEDPATKRLIEFEKRAKALGVNTPLVAQFGAALQNLRNDQFNQSLVDSNRAIEKQIGAFDKATWEAKEYELQVDAAAKKVDKFTTEMERQVELTAKLEGKKLDAAARTPLENVQRDLERLGDLKSRGALSDRGYNAAVTRALMDVDGRLSQPPQLPRALEAGSAEALSFITRAKYESNNGRSGSLADRIPELMTMLQTKHDEQIDLEKRTAEACEQFLDAFTVAGI